MKRALLNGLILFACGTAWAQDPPIPVALVLSGGVSLGSYQAGYLYYTSQLFQANKTLFKPKVITGTSAGGINSLLAVLSMCGRPSQTPHQSALWQMWVDLRGRDLLHPPEDQRALISREGLQPLVNEIKSELSQGLNETCDIVLGVVATRVKPAVNLGLNAVDLSRQQEKFSVRIRGQGFGRPPLITNYLNVLLGTEQTLLALNPGEFEQNFDAIRDLLFASSAFPLVFPPQKIKYCLTDPAADRWIHADYPLTCKPAEVREDEFVDGGLFDNRPLALADRLTRTGLTAEGCEGTCWREIPLPLATAPAKNPSVLFLYFDNNAVGYPERHFSSNPKDLLPYLGVLLENFINSSRDRDSLSTFELNPDLKMQIATTKSIYPRAGDGLYGFFGFFDRELREYDFYLGMYEASLFFQRKLSASLYRGQLRVSESFVTPETTFASAPEWEPYFCLKEQLQGASDSIHHCKAVDSNFRILVKSSIARLSALCSQVNNRADYVSCSHFSDSKDRGQFEDNESEFAFTLRGLAENHYEFKDLELSRSQAGEAGAVIKTQSLGLVRRLASMQSSGDSVAVNAVGPLLINTVETLPNEREFFLSLGPTSKFGASFLAPALSGYPPTARFVLAAEMTETDNSLRLPTPLLGLEFEFSSLRVLSGKTRLSLFSGYQFNTMAGGIDRCRGNSKSRLDCSGVVVQPGVSVTFLERLRLSVDFATLPFVHNHAHFPPWSVLPGIGLQFYL